ncbi:MAG TPA: potassium transporter TrkG [Nevskia sp.]|mgnify:CR=1 FL=1|nr:potassium transporter TrkG [Nevskia sp.]HET7798662.1 potassium transporter TrkG [Nevskia sp.]
MLKDLLNVARPLGILLMAFSVAFLPPIGISLLNDEGALRPYLAGLAANFGLGLLLWLVARRNRRELKSRDGFLLVALTWTLLAATAAVPLMIGLGMSFTDAYFETMSGFTTTGATVLTGLDGMDHAHNLWRHELCWLGGLGIIGLAMAVLPLLGVGGMQVYRAEATGPIKDSRLTPRLVQTARSLWLIYTGLTAACALALWLAGMTAFDAICHAFASLSLGGFSTHDASIGYFDSVLVEVILIVFMVLAGINFATHFLALRGRSLRPYWRDAEALAMIGVLVGSCVGIALYIWISGVYPDFWTALRYASFNLVSVALDCGLVNADFGQWPIAAGFWILAMSCVAASAGSTGGGIKMIRTLILFKQSGRELTSLVHPSAMHSLKVGGQVVSERTILSVFGFIHLYTISIVVFALLLLISGLDPVTAFSAVVTTMNNAGPGLGLVGPATTFAVLTDFQTWVCTVAMLTGRLEVFVLIVLLTPTFWRE